VTTTAAEDRSTALSTVVIDKGVLSGAELVARVQRVREVMRDLMEEGVHFGKVPGTQKPSLWKPGAELLLMTFRIGPRLEVEDLSNHDEIRYRVKVIGFAQVSGESLAEGIGEASTNEEKYRWRASVHEKEWDATPEDRRRIKYSRDGAETRQIRTSPADLANTVLLMAVKRGTVNMTRVVTACSDIFDQDLEDLPAELIQAGAGATPAATEKREVQRASEKTGGAKPAPAVDNGTGVFITSPLKVKDVRTFKTKKGETGYALTLVGDETEYTTRNAKMAVELEGFKGTDHLIRVSFKKTTGRERPTTTSNRSSSPTRRRRHPQRRPQRRPRRRPASLRRRHSRAC
jgi:hypothetical protein